jgi:hypothetical protein
LLDTDSINNKKAKAKSINPTIVSIGNTNDPIMNNTKAIIIAMPANVKFLD